MQKLKDKVAVITGGNSGIGLATAQLFASEGARVVITGRRQDALDQAVSLIGSGAIGIQGDASKLDDLDALYADVGRRLGRIDVLMANAGVISLAPLPEVTEESFDRQVAVNLKGTLFSVQKALPLMPDESCIVLTSSIAHLKALDAHNVYAATKAAVRSFARSWASDLKARRIRVNCLSPGPVDTPIIAKMGVGPEQFEEFDKAVASAIPLGRLGRPEELARAALFLASEDGSFVNGIDLCVDGGLAQV